MTPPTRVALALGSGGARGYAHIGAIRALHERGAEVVSVAGSSMGALVGGLLAAGRLDEYTDWATGLTQLDVLRLLDLSISAPGAIRAEKILARVRDLLGDVQIEQLAIPYTAVAADLVAQKEVWFQRGPLVTAIRASISIPGIFTPVVLNGRLLADGGLMDPVPVAPIASAGADLTVAISLIAEPRGALDLAPIVETADARPVEEWIERFRRGAANLMERDVVRSWLARFGQGQGGAGAAATDSGDVDEATAPLGEHQFGTLPAGLTKLDVMNQSLDAMRSVLARYRLAGFPPDVLIEIPKSSCRSLDFHKAGPMIELGYELTVAKLDEVGFPITAR